MQSVRRLQWVGRKVLLAVESGWRGFYVKLHSASERPE